MTLEDYIFKQERIGMGGRVFTIYKIRTMYNGHTISIEEKTQASENGLYGKIENDPRCTKIGRSLRKYWVDELPQLWNIFRGEMKFVGVRPLTKEEFKRLPKDLQKERIKHKPALISHLYTEKLNGWDKRIEAERKYFKRKKEHPIATDLFYFFKVFYNIVFKGARGV